MLHTLSRTELLVRKEGLDKLKNSKVVVFGIGGVGSYTTEALARAGVGNLVLVDNDSVCISNINRQIHATYETVGRIKVEVMKERIALINKECNVNALQIFITDENIHEVVTSDVDYVVDAIDTVSSKLALAEYCYKNGINIISSMGTGNKMEPSMFKVSDIHNTKVCPLAKVMRYELKKRGVKKLKVVYSEEIPMKPDSLNLPKVENTDEKIVIKKRQTPGSMSFVPPVSGMIMAGEVIKEILGDIKNRV